MILIANILFKCKDRWIKALLVHMFKVDFIKEFLKVEIYL